MANTRKTLIELAAPALFGPGSGKGYTLNLNAVKSAGDVAFQATVEGAADVGTFDVSDASGKVRTFRDADDFFKQAGALSLTFDTMVVKITGLTLVAPRPFTGDIIKKAQSTVAAYTKQRTDAQARASKLVQEATLMAADPTVPQARRDENTAQKTAVDSLIAFLSAEIARIGAVLAPAGA